MLVWETDVTAFVLDTLAFIEGQIECAKRDPKDQVAAVDAACGVIPFFRERMLGLDHPITPTLMFVFDDWYEHSEWERHWKELGTKAPKDFCLESEKLLQQIATVREV